MLDAFGIGSRKMRPPGWPHYLLDNPARKRRIFSMPRELTLDGGEITLLKRIGLSGGAIYGRLLVDELEKEEIPPFLETLTGLLEQDYVLTNRVNVRVIEDVQQAFFRVNPAFAIALRDAVRPSRRRELERERERTRRRRRR